MAPSRGASKGSHPALHASFLHGAQLPSPLSPFLWSPPALDTPLQSISLYSLHHLEGSVLSLQHVRVVLGRLGPRAPS